MGWINVEDQSPPVDEWILLGSADCGSTFGVYLMGKFVNPDLNYLEIKSVNCEYGKISVTRSLICKLKR